MNIMISTIKVLRLLLTALLLMLWFTQSAYANLVTNPFFAGSATTATNWTSSAAGASAAFNSNTRAVNATITAAGGSTEFYSGCVGAACLTFPFVNGTSSGAQQNIATVVGITYTLSFWTYYSTTGATNEIDVYWGNTKVYGLANVATGWTLHTVNLGSATSTSTALTVLIRDDPNFSAITYMDVEPVVLRLAKTNPASLAVGVPANYILTATNITTTTSGTSFQIQDQLPPNIAFNSAAAGTGIASVTGCATSGALATGLIVTCTANVTGGIAPGGTGTLTVNVTPQAASAGTASTNKASVQVNGGVANVTGTTTPLPGPATASTCTGTDTPTLGCVVAASITPSAAQLSFSKTVIPLCDPVNGNSNPKNIPGAAVQYALNIANTGSASVVLTTVTDPLQLIGASGIVFDPKLNSGALPATNCVRGNLTNSLSATGFSAVSGAGAGPGPVPTTTTPNAVTAGAVVSGQNVTITYSGAGILTGTGIPGWNGTLNAGNYITVFFNTFVQ